MSSERDEGRRAEGHESPGAEGSTLASVMRAAPLFRELDDGQRDRVATWMQRRHHDAGEDLLVEGEADDALYLVVAGEVTVRKRVASGDAELPLQTLGAGAVVGELKLFGRRRSSATVRCTAPTESARLALDHIGPSGQLADLRGEFQRLAGGLMAERMVTASGDAVGAMQAELGEARMRLFAGRFLLLIVTLMSANSLAVEALDWLAPSFVPRAELLAFVIVGVGALVMALGLRLGPFTRQELGLSFARGWAHVGHALLVTLPVLLVMLVVKLALSGEGGPYAGHPLFEYGAIFRDGSFDLTVYVLALVGYAIHSPLQEFFVRAGLQYPMERLLPPKEGRVSWPAIIVSNLFFAAAHSFLGIGFSLVVILPGIFWGWLYARQRSLIGPAVSHLLIGYWAMFALGLQVAIR